MPRRKDRQTGADIGRARKQARDAAAFAVAAGKTIAEAAAEARIGERTLYRWLKQPGFKRRVNEFRDRLVSEAVGKLSSSMGGAALVLDALLKARGQEVRLRAARAILEMAGRLRQTEELERRLAELEERFAAGDGGGSGA